MGISPPSLMLKGAVLLAGLLGSSASPSGVKKVMTPDKLFPIKGEDMTVLCKFKTTCADYVVQFFGRFPDHDENDRFFLLATYDGASTTFPSSSPLSGVDAGSQTDTAFSIIVKTIRPSDHGDYVCVVTAGGEEKNSTTQVFVLEPVPALGSFVLNAQTQERRISCTIGTLPAGANVQMRILNGTVEIASTNFATENQHPNLVTSSYSFNHEPVTLSKYDNAGIFKCEAKWKGNTYESENDIEQRYLATSLTLTKDTNPAPLNHKVSCITDAGFPAPVVLFFLDGSQVFGGITEAVALSTTINDANNGLKGRFTEAEISINSNVHDGKVLCCRVSDLPNFPAGPLLQQCTGLSPPSTEED